MRSSASLAIGEPVAAWTSKNLRPAAGPSNLPSSDARNGHKIAAPPAARDRHAPTSHRPLCCKHSPQVASGSAQTPPSRYSPRDDPSAAPPPKRLAVAVAGTGPSIDDLDALLAFAVGVGARIERVLEHCDHIAVADQRPFESDQRLAVGRAREVNLLGGH